jgi:hypothetical protein
MSPSPSFIRRTRNPDAAFIIPRETASQIAQRLREGIAPVPMVKRDVA